MSKLNENIFPCAEDEFLFGLLCIFNRMEAKSGKSVFFPFLQMCLLNRPHLHFFLPKNVFVESTAFAFVSYACRFDIHFELIAQIKFSNWITSYTKLMENMSMKCQTTTKLNTCLETIWIRFILQTLTSTCNEDKQFTTFDLNFMQNMLSDFLVSYLSCWNIRYQIWHCMWDINHGLAQALTDYHHVIVSSCHHVIIYVLMALCHLVILSSCNLVILSSCNLVIL